MSICILLASRCTISAAAISSVIFGHCKFLGDREEKAAGSFRNAEGAEIAVSSGERFFSGTSAFQGLLRLANKSVDL